MTVNDKLLSFQIAQQIRLLRLSNTHAKEIRAILQSADVKLAQAILAENSGRTNYTKARSKALRKRIAAVLQDSHAEAAAYVRKTVSAVGDFSVDVETTALHNAVPVAVDIIAPNILAVTAVLATPMNGAGLDSWLATLKINDVNRTYRAIQEGLISGESTDDIVRSVIGSRSLNYKDGSREVSRRGASMLIRTYTNHAASMGRQAVWEANSDIIKSVRWVSTLDGRTSEICRFRDGKTYSVYSGPRPPAHPSCRSTTVAVVKSWREMGIDIDEMTPGTRASMNGQVPSDLTYYKWLQTQSATFQREVLGARRFDLWKKGDVAVESFHNDAGRLLTLEQLKVKMPEAFKQAFG